MVRYDAATKKRIKGLDHFCKWLNTPVGFRNYPHFFTLVVLCNVQVVYTLAISIVALAAWGASAYVCVCMHVGTHARTPSPVQTDTGWRTFDIRDVRRSLL